MSRRKDNLPFDVTNDTRIASVPRGLKDVVLVSRKAEAHDIAIELLKRLEAAESDYKKAQLMPLTVRANHETAYLRGIHEAYKEIVKWIVHRR
jgi:hypothetical protein